MTNLRLSTINKAIAQYEMELVKGKDYFYFISTKEEGIHPIQRCAGTSVWVARLNDLTFEEWVEEAVRLYNEGLALEKDAEGRKGNHDRLRL